MYLYNRNQCYDGYLMILESPLQFHMDGFFQAMFCCFVLYDVDSLVPFMAVIKWLNSEFGSFGGNLTLVR